MDIFTGLFYSDGHAQKINLKIIKEYIMIMIIVNA